MKKDAVMIWTPDGVWLQTYDSEGNMKLSGCGKLSRPAVEFFCASRGIELSIRNADARELRANGTVSLNNTTRRQRI